MRVRLVRLIKAYCPDFEPIRHILVRQGGHFVEQKEQRDYFFKLPSRAGATPRLKLRLEDGRPKCLYYYDRMHPSSIGSFEYVELRDHGITGVLSQALGIEVIVEKHREVWTYGRAIVNLDRIEKVGQIFEVELPDVDSKPAGEQAAYYRQVFGDFLGADIDGSNEDLVASMSATQRGIQESA